MTRFPRIGDIFVAPWLMGPMLVLDITPDAYQPEWKRRVEIFAIDYNRTGDTTLSQNDLWRLQLVAEADE